MAAGGGGGLSTSNGATGGAGGSTAASTGNVAEYAGGTGFDPNGATAGGGGGSSAGSASNGTNATSQTGATAPSEGGNGANGGASGANGSAATQVGGGGGQRSGGSESGGGGAAGQIRLTYTAATEVRFSGTLYSDAGVTPVTGSSKTIKLAVGTSTVSVHSTTTNSSTGEFQFAISLVNLTANETPITIWLDGDSNKASLTSTIADIATDLTGMHLYQGRVIVRDEGGTGLRLADLDTYDSTNDSDLQFTAATSTGELTIRNGQTLYVWSGDTFENAASSTLTGSLVNNGTFTKGSGVMTLTGTSETLSGTLTGTSELGKLRISGSYTASNNASTSDLTILSGGSFAAPASGLLSIASDFTNNGTFTNNNSTVHLKGKGYDISSYTSGTSIALSVAGEEATPADMLFNDDGTILYVLGSAGDDINAYPLPTPYDISSYTSGTSIALSVAGQETTPTAMLFNDDGTILYVLGSAGDDINAYPLPPSSTVSGTAIGTSAFSDVVVDAGATAIFSTTASTSDLTINTGGTLTMQAGDLDIDGNFTNHGRFTASSSEVIFSGTSLQTATGTMTGTSAFHDLTITNTSGTGATQSVTFGAPVTATGTLTMLASTSAAFPAGATSTFTNVSWQGSGASPVWLRSSSEGTQWYLDITGSQLSVDYVNVKDSNASSSAEVVATNSTDAGNNSNWNFGGTPPEAGSSTIANHDAGRVSNAFSFQNKTNEPLFAFKLTPESGTATVTELVISLYGAKKIDTSDFSNLRLLRDHDNDAAYDASDEVIGGAGVMTLGGTTGTLTFSTDFLATTSQNYLVVADWNAPENGAFLTLDLYPSGVSAIDENGSQTIFGTVSHTQHSRNNRGGGGGSRAAIGGELPPGRSVETGGTNDGGEMIGDDDPLYKWPTAHTGAWNNGQYAYDRVDGTYAGTNVNLATSTYQNHGFSVPTTNTVTGIEFKLEVSGTAAGGSIDVALSSDSGVSWTTAKNTGTLTTTDRVITLGGTSDKWGRSWSPANFSNANFRVRVTGNVSDTETLQIDALQVKVHSIATGGGQDGGGAISI